MLVALKIVVSALLIAAASELAKRNSILAALLISLPVTSILALSWGYVEGTSSADLAKLSMGIFWLVLPSLVFFPLLSRLLYGGILYWNALLLSCSATAVLYFVFATFSKKIGINL